MPTTEEQLAKARAERAILQARLDAVVQSQPRALRAVASISGQDDYGTALGGEAGAKQVSKWLGVSVKKIDAFANVKFFRSDGTFELADGSVVTKEELAAMVAV